ncbi:MAG: luciferase [Ilumatobacteraceae bacterium]|nr:luciferase [Ilumatobacteraceae bacterium]
MNRYAMSVPLPGPFSAQRELFGRLQDLGYTDLWSSETAGYDAFTPLALASEWAPEMRLGTAVVPVFTRGPALLAQTVATIAEAAPGRFVLGIGASSNVIVERWNAQPFDRPFSRTRDVLRFLRSALAGEKVSRRYDTFEVSGFRLGVVPEQAPPILVAALRERMLRLGGTEADGVILNWLSAEDVGKVAPLVHEGGADKEIVCRIFVCPTDDPAARDQARQFVTSYLNVPVYADYQRFLGRGELLRPMQELWQAGDRKGALAAVPEQVIDDLIVLGTPSECQARIQQYVERGVTTPMLAIMPWGVPSAEAIAALAPANVEAAHGA